MADFMHLRQTLIVENMRNKMYGDKWSMNLYNRVNILFRVSVYILRKFYAIFSIFA